jgi:hypothetical protein
MLVLSVTVSALYSSLDGIVKFGRQLRLPTEQEFGLEQCGCGPVQ